MSEQKHMLQEVLYEVVTDVCLDAVSMNLHRLSLNVDYLMSEARIMQQAHPQCHILV